MTLPPRPERRSLSALRLLILGGTTEASALSRAVAGRGDLAPILSFAGRTESPVAPATPFRVGGFGGPEGLAAFLRGEGIDAVVDATHPFAARISANAVVACRAAGVPLVVYTRPAWKQSDATALRDGAESPTPSLRGAPATKQPRERALLGGFASLAMTDEADCENVIGRDRWTFVRDIEGAVTLLHQPPRRVFITTGRLELARFRAVPQHRYLIRTIDPPDPADLPHDATVVLARGPFTLKAEAALMLEHAVDLLVTKNSGGTATAAKLVAAHELRIPVLMVDRPARSGALELHSIEGVLDWIADQPRRP